VSPCADPGGVAERTAPASRTGLKRPPRRSRNRGRRRCPQPSLAGQRDGRACHLLRRAYPELERCGRSLRVASPLNGPGRSLPTRSVGRNQSRREPTRHWTQRGGTYVDYPAHSRWPQSRTTAHEQQHVNGTENDQGPAGVAHSRPERCLGQRRNGGGVLAPAPAARIFARTIHFPSRSAQSSAAYDTSDWNSLSSQG